jgi:class 3 adenylate cyclase
VDTSAPHQVSTSALVSLGVSPEAAAEYVERGDPAGALFDAVLLSGRRKRKVTAAAIEDRGGLRVEQIAALMEAFGLARPGSGDPAFTPEEAGALVELGELDELWPAEVRIQVARAYGAMIAGIARAELQAFQAYTEPHVREQEGDAAAQLRTIQAAFRRLLPLADPLILGVHRRWIEHELAQRAVSAAEQEAGAATLPGAVAVTFLFCDLKDFTAYAEVSGDEAAIRAIDRFFEVVARERGSGEIVKSLGDGAMLVFLDPAEAVSAGLRMIGAMREGEQPGIHASVHRGTALARSGDYFGGSVNLAARLLALSERDELVATTEVVKACGAEFRWRHGGDYALRGVAHPVAVYRLA